MTEAEWFDCNDCATLLQFALDKVSHRKLRLFACACYRQLKAESPGGNSYLLGLAERFAEGLANAEEVQRVAERFADGEASPEELQQAEGTIRSPALRALGTAGAVLGTLWASTWHRAWAAANGAANASAEVGLFRGQADLFREIIGNPFRQPEAPAQWPPAILALAEALDARSNCHYALHDALLEAGYAEWAHHFTTAAHPRGCWALDLILNRE